MKIRLLLFAAYREMFGRSRLDVEVPTGATLDDLYALLQEQQPALAALRPYTSFAVNREFASPDTELHPSDEVALLQPVSGGQA